MLQTGVLEGPAHPGVKGATLRDCRVEILAPALNLLEVWENEREIKAQIRIRQEVLGLRLLTGLVDGRRLSDERHGLQVPQVLGETATRGQPGELHQCSTRQAERMPVEHSDDLLKVGILTE